MNEIVIKTAIDTTGIDDGIKEIQAKIEKMSKVTAEVGASVEDAVRDAVGVSSEELEGMLDRMGDRFEEFVADFCDGFIEGFTESTQGMEKPLDDIEKRFTNVVGRMDTNLAAIANSVADLGTASKSVGNLGQSVGRVATEGKKIAPAMNKASVAMKGFFKRAFSFAAIIALVRKFVSVFKQQMNALKNSQTETGRIIQEYQAAMTTFKNSLSAAFAPLINTILPILTRFIQKLTEIINKVAQFTAALFGQSVALKAVKVATEDEMKAQQKQQSYLSGLDEVRKNEKEPTEQGTGFTEVPIDPNMVGLAEEFKEKFAELLKKLEPVKQKLVEIKDAFVEGFQNGFAEDMDFTQLKDDLSTIGESAKNIFTDPKVKKAANDFVLQTSKTLGTLTGSAASIGKSVTENLVGGMAEYLGDDKNQERIKEHIVTMFEVGSDVEQIAADTASAAANIMEFVGGENAQKVTANTIGIVASAGMTLAEVGSKAGRDLADGLTRPIIDNQEGIKTALDTTSGLIGDNLGTIKDMVDQTGQELNTTYDEHIHPLNESITSGVSEITGAVVDGYNEELTPTLSNISSGWSALMSEHIQPLISEFLKLWGSICDAVQFFWEQYLQPFINYIVENVWPLIKTFLQNLWNTVSGVIGMIVDVIRNIITVIRGVIDFIVGVFSGDWNKAWNGIKTVFSGVWGAIKSIFLGIINFLKNIFLTVFGTIWETIKNIVNNAISAIKEAIRRATQWVKNTVNTLGTAIKTAFTWIKDKIVGIVTTIVNWVRDKFTAMKDKVVGIWGGIKSKTSEIWGNIKNGVVTVAQTVYSNVRDKFNSAKESAKTAFENMKTAVGSRLQTIKTNASTVVGNIKKNITEKFTAIKTGVINAFTKMKEGIATIFDKIKNALKVPINAIIGFINGLVSGVVSGINAMIRALNHLHWKIPDWVPFLGGKEFGFSISEITPPQIPLLAQGAVIPANKEFLAVLGDQKNGNNLEAPEELLRQIVREESGGRGSNVYNVTATANRKVLFEMIIEEGKSRKQMTGKNPFAFA